MGIFGNLDVASADSNPWFVPAGIYEAIVIDVKVLKDKHNSPGLAINYKITSEGDSKNKRVSEWKVIPTPKNPKELTKEEEIAASFLKMRLADFEIEESKMNSFDPKDLKGMAVSIKVVLSGDDDEYSNITKVTPVH